MRVWRLRFEEDEGAFKSAYASLLFALSLNTNDQLSSIAERMKSVDLDEIWRITKELQKTNKDYSPNLAAFPEKITCARRNISWRTALKPSSCRPPAPSLEDAATAISECSFSHRSDDHQSLNSLCVTLN